MSSILAIEASAEACSVALACGGQVYSRSVSRAKSHSQVILPIVDELFTEADFIPANLDAIAYDCGPGAFTGLRIGLSFSQGLALGWNKPLLAIGSLHSLAQATFSLRPEISSVVTLLDARMGEFYAAVFERNGSDLLVLKQPFLCAYAQVEEQMGTFAGMHTALVGLGVRETSAAWQTQFAYVDECLNPDAVAMLELAQSAWQRAEAIPVEQAELLYLRNSVTWDKHKPRRNRDL
ncbi:MAG TPA: tRNA (adenosine(37)-N6)-threonylcarbamoyltransferase complex dimerization subunit type 1 TsaB [Cellvibrionaceae bacterium]